MGWEIINLNPRPRPGAYVLRKQGTTFETEHDKTLPSEMPNQSSSTADFLVSPNGETYPQTAQPRQNGAGRGEEPQPLPNSAMNPIAEERRQRQIEETRRQLQKHIVLVILSNIKNENLVNLLKRPSEFLANMIAQQNSNHLTFQELGASSEEELNQFIISGLSETLELWMKEINLRTAPEREKDLRRWFAVFKSQGHEVRELIEIVCRHFNIELSEKYRQPPTSSLEIKS